MNLINWSSEKEGGFRWLLLWSIQVYANSMLNWKNKTKIILEKDLFLSNNWEKFQTIWSPSSYNEKYSTVRKTLKIIISPSRSGYPRKLNLKVKLHSSHRPTPPPRKRGKKEKEKYKNFNLNCSLYHCKHLCTLTSHYLCTHLLTQNQPNSKATTQCI